MSSWDDTSLQALAGEFRVVVFDLPGTGYSGPTHGPATVASEADVVAGLVEALGLSGTTLLGWGVGGEIALATAERHPGSVARLVLLDATAGGADGTPPSAALAHALASPDETTAELSSLYFPRDDERARLAWLADLSGPAPDDLVASAIRASAAFARAAYADRSVAAELGRVRLPTLVLSGSEDEVVPPDNSARIAAALHVAEVTLPGAGYASMAEQRATVLADLEAFVAPAAATGSTGAS